MSKSVRQYQRVAEVVIGKGGSGLLVINLRIKFEVTKTVDAAPNVAKIAIYNLSPSNEARVKNEYDEVLLNAGYQGAARLVFRGNIKHVYRYREGNDTITEIEAADGDKDYRNAIVNETLAAGTSNRDIIERALTSFNGTTRGHIDIPTKTRLRGKVISGSTREVLHDVARDAGANWSIQDGTLNIVKADAIMPGEAIVIRADTGLLGAPEINEKGITVKCLLNPQIRINGAVKIDNNGIKAKKAKAGKVEKTQDTVIDDETIISAPIKLDPDGIYKAIKLIHRGDTRGSGSGDWSTEALCIALGSAAGSTKKQGKK